MAFLTIFGLGPRVRSDHGINFRPKACTRYGFLRQKRPRKRYCRAERNEA
jgi:hypothetical protein